MKFIKSELKDHVGIITLNNDEKRNSMSLQMLKELSTTFDLMTHQKARVVIIRSNPGAGVWSAGLDISELPEPGKDPLPYNHPLELVLRKIEDFEGPVIAMIEGTVWGGGCDMAFTCDLLIGSPQCSFAITPAKIGVPYNAAGLVHFMNMMEMNIAKEMFFTAAPVSAERAFDLGILNHLVPLDDLEEFTMKMATRITYNSPLAISVIKQQINLLGKARPMNPTVFEQITELRRKAYNSHDFMEGKNAFLEKRRPIFKGE